MFITSAMIFYLIGKKYSIQKRVQKSHNLLENVRMYRGKCVSKSCLYVVDSAEMSSVRRELSGFSFLFFNCRDLHDSITENVSDAAYLDGVSDGFELLEDVFDIFQRLSSWNSSLAAAKGSDEPFERFFELGGEIMDRPYMLIDRNFYVPAYSSFYAGKLQAENSSASSGGIYRVPADYSTRILSDPEIEKIFHRTTLFLYPERPKRGRFMCRNIINEGQFIASLVSPISDDEDWPDTGFIHIFLHFFSYLKEIYMKYIGDTFTMNQSNSLHKLIRSLLFSDMPAPELAEIHDIMHVYHWEPEHSFLLVKLQFFKGDQLGLSSQYICQRLEKEWPNSCTLETDNYIVWVIDLTISQAQLGSQGFHQALAYIVREHLCKAGVSETFSDITALKSYLLQADYALLLGQRTDPYLWYYSFENYIIRYFCEKSSMDFPVKMLAHPGLYKLIMHDRENGTEYAKTLWYFYHSGFNSTKASGEMFLHRTTFIRRLDRIKEISGITPENADELLHILMTFELMECRF